MSEVRVKATPANGLASYIQRTLTPEQLARLKPQLGGEELRILEGRLLANESVPVDTLNHLTERAAHAAGQPVFEFGRAAGLFGAEQGTRTVYKFILALLSPQSTLRMAPAMWARVYSGGRLEVEVGDHTGRIHVRDFPAHDGLCGRIGAPATISVEISSPRSIPTSSRACAGKAGSVCARPGGSLSLIHISEPTRPY